MLVKQDRKLYGIVLLLSLLVHIPSLESGHCSKMVQTVFQSNKDIPKNPEEVLSFLTERLKDKGQKGEDLLSFFVNSQKKHQREILEHFDDFLEGQRKSFLARKFKRLQKIIKKEESFQVKRKRAEDAENSMKAYRKLLFECTSSRWNEARNVTTGTFKFFMMAMAAGSSATTMGWNNRERDPLDWGGQVSFEISSELAENFVRSLILSRVQMSAAVKALAMFVFSRTWMIGDSFGFQHFVGINDSDIQQALEDILKNPEMGEELKLLIMALDEKNFWQQFQENYEWMGGRHWHSLNIEEIDWNTFSESDLDNEKIRAVVEEALFSKIYNETRGDWMNFGLRSFDRYVFDSFNDVIAPVRETMIGLYIYRNLCMKSLDTKRFVKKSIYAFLINRIVSDYIYYTVRKTAVGF